MSVSPNAPAHIPEPSDLVVAPLKYRQVEREIRQLAKTLPVGARLPSERSMAKLYDCNFLTVRKALKQLVEEGRIVRRVGSGTFVGDPSTPEPADHRGNRNVGGANGTPAGGVTTAAAGHTAPATPPARRVGLLVVPSGNTYASRLLQEIAHAGLEEGIEISSRWVRDFSDDALGQAEQLRQEGCAALALPWFPFEKVDEVRDFVSRSPLQVSLPMVIPGLERNSFVNPLRFGGGSQRAVEALSSYFLELGARHIAFLGPDAPADVILQKSLTAYACRASREGLPGLCGLVQPGTRPMDQIAARWREHCRDGNLAIISYDDEHALRFMTAMHKLGQSAPRDYRIIGFNDTEASVFSDPPLSTIPQNFDDISTWLLRNALALARGEVAQSPGGQIPRLIVRSTCGGRGKIDDDFRARLPMLNIIMPATAAEAPALPSGIVPPSSPTA
ncbi:transcriptional regulator [Opitutaceae bacterium TAV1]|nr:transcriptional regulator [Opitutaceae bacterium TAV1]